MMRRWRKHGDGPGTGKPLSARHGPDRAGRVLVCLMMCRLFLGAPQAFSQSTDDAEYKEYKLKLAFLYNFTLFVEWPPEAFQDPDAPLTVCVVGENPFRGELEQSLRGRRAGRHPIELKKLMPEDNPKACHLIFIRASEKRAAEKVLTDLNGSSTLTVGETKGFTQRGGVINLVQEDNKLGIEINVDAADRSRLRISSKLLALSKIVNEPRNP